MKSTLYIAIICLIVFSNNARAECRLNSPDARCLGPAVYVFGHFTYLYTKNQVLFLHKEPFYQSDVRFDETYRKEILPWIGKIAGKHAGLEKALKLIQVQYIELAERLRKTSAARIEILEDFGAGSNVSEFDEDERNLSAMGLRLAQLSKQFFQAIRPTLLRLRKARLRAEAQEGLNGFDASLVQIEQKVSLSKPDASTSESINAMQDVVSELENALRDLEKAVGKK